MNSDTDSLNQLAVDLDQFFLIVCGIFVLCKYNMYIYEITVVSLLAHQRYSTVEKSGLQLEVRQNFCP